MKYLTASLAARSGYRYITGTVKLDVEKKKHHKVICIGIINTSNHFIVIYNTKLFLIVGFNHHA